MILSPFTQKTYPVHTSVADIDIGYEAEEAEDGYFYGQIDPDYEVRWVYTEDAERIGCLEIDEENKAHLLLYRDTPWGTYLQEDGWSADDQSIWSRMTPAAYEECFRKGWITIEDLQKQTSVTLLQLNDVISGNYPTTYTLCKCGKSTSNEKGVYTPFTVICVDSDGIVYIPPSTSSLWKILNEV
jgi:hypothetical protein